MNNLPQELVDRISSYLDQHDLKSTLLISRQFQYAAEQYSGGFRNYVLTERNVDKFLNTYSAHRLRYLRYVHFATSFPALEPADDALPCRETTEELQLLDQEFTRQIRFLFWTLKTLERSSVYASRKIHLSIYTPTQAVNLDGICLHHNFVSWRVHLLSPMTLPSITSVRHLAIRNAEAPPYSKVPNPPLRKLDLRVLLDLLSKFPNLSSLQCQIGGDEWYNSFANIGLRHIARDCAGPRRDSRHAFGKALQAFPSLHHIELDFLHPLIIVDSIDQRRALPNLIKPAIYDPFSTSLRLLSYQLRTMKLRVVADTTLFWPTDNSTATPSWPNLESIHVMFHMATPSGSWYFRGLPGVGATEGFDVNADSYPPLSPTEDTILNDHCDDGTADGDSGDDRQLDIVQFRVDPNEEVIVPFLTAFAKAAASMPLLKDAALWTPLSFNVGDLQDEYEDFDASQVSRFLYGGLAWGFAYTKPGMEAFDSHTGENFSNSRQMWWRVAKWRPDPQLRHLFQKIGREHGEHLIEYWNSVYSGEGLEDREYFEEHGCFIEPPNALVA
jgi:hypothetical protein